MKRLVRVILMVVAAITGLYAVVGVGYGTFGVFVALCLSNGGFVGEGDFYASGLLCISLVVLTTGVAAGIISYMCWPRRDRPPV